MSLSEKISSENIPQHIAIIMDGNGRWAKSRGLERSEGHRNGADAVRKTVTAAGKVGVKYLTLYAFSTENWNRPSDEVNAIMKLLVFSIKQETPELMKNNVRLMAIGQIDRLAPDICEMLNASIEKTKNNTGLTLVLALSYSSKNEIASAVKKIVSDVENKKIDENSIDEKLIDKYLFTHNIPDPDLMIRTSGELRISNFLLWQIAYSELYFTDTLWPDFDEESLYMAILSYQKRERRFGMTADQLLNNATK